MDKRLWIAVVVAVLAGGTYALFFRRSDEGQIRRQLAALAAAVRVEDGPGNPVFRAVHLKDAFAHVFVPRVEMDVPEIGREPMRREDLVGVTVAAESPFHAASLDFTGVRVAIEDPPTFARGTGTAAGLGVQGDGRMRAEKRDFSMRFEKAGGEWRIAAVSATPTR